MPEPSPTAGAVGTSSAIGTVTVEEVMELVMFRYIDFPGVGVIDLEAPQLPEEVLDMATEWMFAKPSIMETTASISKALQSMSAPTASLPMPRRRRRKRFSRRPRLAWS
jgi:hypothetical protein